MIVATGRYFWAPVNFPDGFRDIPLNLRFQAIVLYRYSDGVLLRLDASAVNMRELVSARWCIHKLLMVWLYGSKFPATPRRETYFVSVLAPALKRHLTTDVQTPLSLWMTCFSLALVSKNRESSWALNFAHLQELYLSSSVNEEIHWARGYC